MCVAVAGVHARLVQCRRIDHFHFRKARFGAWPAGVPERTRVEKRSRPRPLDHPAALRGRRLVQRVKGEDSVNKRQFGCVGVQAIRSAIS